MWNVVTSVNDSEAQNYGMKEHLAHDARYDRADEFLEATTGLWDTWDDDALIFDRATPRFADPDKVHELDYDGEWFSVRGPLDGAPVPTGSPRAAPGGIVRPRAATSQRVGPSSSSPGTPTSRSPAPTTKTRRHASVPVGRDPMDVKMLPMAYTVIGESKAHAGKSAKSCS